MLRRDAFQLFLTTPKQSESDICVPNLMNTTLLGGGFACFMPGTAQASRLS